MGSLGKSLTFRQVYVSVIIQGTKVIGLPPVRATELGMNGSGLRLPSYVVDQWMHIQTSKRYAKKHRDVKFDINVDGAV